MTEETRKLYDKAQKARHLYIIGKISRGEAKEEISPYIEKFNETSKRIAKKYNQSPKITSFSAFVR